MGSMAQEKERGTAAMLLIKPVRRSAVVLTKGLTVLSLVAAGLLLSTLGCALYTAILFEALPFQAFLILNLLLFLYFSVYVSITLLASTLARTQSVAAAGAFAGLALLLILGSIPRFGEYLPGKLLQWGTSGVLGDSITTWPALWVGLGIIAASFTIACLYFEKEEI
jgi:ABC-2 type transport system permease protein